MKAKGSLLSALLVPPLIQWEIRIKRTHRSSVEGESPYGGVEALILI